MIRKSVNLPASTTITVQHFLKFICLQMLQINHLNEELNLYMEKQKEQRRKETYAMCEIKTKERICEILVPLTKTWKFASTEV